VQGTFKNKALFGRAAARLEAKIGNEALQQGGGDLPLERADSRGGRTLILKVRKGSTMDRRSRSLPKSVFY